MPRVDTMFLETLEVASLYHLQGGKPADYDSHLWTLDPRTQRLWMFCYHKDKSPWKTYDTLRLELAVHLPAAQFADDEREAWYYGHARLMQFMVFAATIGWDLFDEPDDERGYDHICVHGHLKANQLLALQELEQALMFGAPELREFTKNDILRSALRAYRESGAAANLSLPNIRNTHCLRIHVQWPLLESCAQDLVHEGLLQSAEYKQAYRVSARNWVETAEELHRRDLRAIEFIDRAADAHGWTRSGTPRSAAKPRMGARPMSITRVFIIHGHDEAKRRELVELLKARFGLDPVVMQEHPGCSRTFIEKFEALA